MEAILDGYYILGYVNSIDSVDLDMKSCGKGFKKEKEAEKKKKKR
jgi:hypothetical protein